MRLQINNCIARMSTDAQRLDPLAPQLWQPPRHSRTTNQQVAPPLTAAKRWIG
jgi:hypothetical protein